MPIDRTNAVEIVQVIASADPEDWDGERIKALRNTLGLSQRELAEIMGYAGPNHICQLESPGGRLKNVSSLFARVASILEAAAPALQVKEGVAEIIPA